MSSFRDFDLLEPAPDASKLTLPPRFAEALTIVRGAISDCASAKIPNDTVVAALMTEVIPALVSVYGPAGVVSLLRQMAAKIEIAGKAATTPVQPTKNRTVS